MFSPKPLDTLPLEVDAEGLDAFRFFLKSTRYVCMVITYSKSMDRPGKVANPTRGQLKRENEYCPVRVSA